VRMTRALTAAGTSRRRRTALTAALLVAITGIALVVAGDTRAPALADPVTHQGGNPTGDPRPTIVLVSGAWEDSTSWSGEITKLEHDGYPVIAPAVPLRGIASDSAYLTSVVRSINGPVVLVGHSYGGNLITDIAANDPKQVKALVYTAAFIPKAGETVNQLDTQFPGSLVGPDTTQTINFPGGTDVYVQRADYRAVFAGDRTAQEAAVAAATQRPIEANALNEPSPAGVPTGIPVYAIVASQDKAIPPAAELFEARRADAVVSTVDSAHDLPTSHPGAVTAVIERAAE
jgi:pimeloyl-ACP methyl ester carboxylesterase